MSGLLCLLRMRSSLRKGLWIGGQFLFAAILIWSWRSRIGTEAEVSEPKLYRDSLIASFSSISIEGPQRQLVFHYTIENLTQESFRIDSGSCSAVSFRFVDAPQTQSTPSPRGPNPALSLLEKNNPAYTKFTGLVRLPSSKPSLSLDQCPVELQPKQKRAVAIAIPYGYPIARGNQPTQDELRTYVRTFMPQVVGFGIYDLNRNYEIVFPQPW